MFSSSTNFLSPKGASGPLQPLFVGRWVVENDLTIAHLSFGIHAFHMCNITVPHNMKGKLVVKGAAVQKNELVQEAADFVLEIDLVTVAVLVQL